jgi:type IV secretion system protein VirD4
VEPSPFKFGYRYDEETDAADPREPQLYYGERHILLFGLNGAGKSTRILVENLVTLQNRSLVVFDVKGELAAMTANARRQFGDVVIVNPCGELNIPSDGYNPLAILNPEAPDFYENAAALGDALIEIEGNDPHWPESAQGLVVALIMWETILARRERRAPSLVNVRMMLTEADKFDGPGRDAKQVRGLAFTAQKMVDEGGPKIASLAGRFTNPDSREINSIRSTADTQTRWLLSDAMTRDLAKHGVDFRRLRDHPTTVYIILPAGEIEHFRKWTRLIITAALRQQMRTGPVKTLFILDEFRASVGNLKVVNAVWSLVRGYGIQLMPVVQSATQLEQLFKTEWENYAAQAGVVVTLGPVGDRLTAEWLSERSGKTTEWRESWNEGEGQSAGGMNTSAGKSISQFERPAKLPQELRSLKVGTGIIWTPGEGEEYYPFFAPEYRFRPEIRPLVGDNPYHPGSSWSGGAASAAGPAAARAAPSGVQHAPAGAAAKNPALAVAFIVGCIIAAWMVFAGMNNSHQQPQPQPAIHHPARR